MVLQLELERLNKNLEKHVTARTSELQKTIDELTYAKDRLIESEKLSALGRMVAGFSHELSTPPGVAITSASFIKDMIHDDGHDDESQHLEMEDLPEDFLDDLSQASRLVNANLQRAHNLISGFKHIAADQASERQRRINPVDYLEDLVLSMYHELKARKMTISVTGRKDLAINTYPGALSQVFTNLVMNSAIHAFSEGEPGEVTIDVSSESDGSASCGINSDTLQRMYEPFFTTRIGGDGIGLGMNIVYSLVLGKLEGRIDCVSSPGQGTQFTIIIPELTESPQPPS
ncbi:MAG: HAMP domain-containing sensor histidine kinase [Spirochaetaceae bacterium]|nr:HAMP domain-containing sensor histidine kinase [Spirochaetaceae bacterium]MDT8297462.1 HAMP domain-containing sensor histidine kinase [Spirochaetaceae bacterium]